MLFVSVFLFLFVVDIFDLLGLLDFLRSITSGFHVQLLDFDRICWVCPPPSNSEHQDYFIFSRGSQPKPSFATVTGREPQPMYMYIC